MNGLEIWLEPDVRAKTKLSRTTPHEAEKKGDFPKNFDALRRKAWFRHEVEEGMRKQAEVRFDPNAPQTFPHKRGRGRPRIYERLPDGRRRHLVTGEIVA